MKRLLVPVILIVAYLGTGIAQVGPGERAVVRRFGAVAAKPGPGLWFGLPWGIDRIDRVPVRTARQLTVGFDSAEASDAPGSNSGQFLTGDQNLVFGRFVVDYLVDESRVEDFLIHSERVPEVLKREAEVAAAEWIARQPVDEALSRRAALARWMEDRLMERIPRYGIGVGVQRVSVESLAAPEEVRDAFEQVNQAQTAIRTRRNAAQQEAERQLSEAAALKHRLDSEAEATRDALTKLAQADAASFSQRREQYARLRGDNPGILAAIWREEIGKLLAGIKHRSRIELLDDYLGPNGLELNTFLPRTRR